MRTLSIIVYIFLNQIVFLFITIEHILQHIENENNDSQETDNEVDEYGIPFALRPKPELNPRFRTFEEIINEPNDEGGNGIEPYYGPNTYDSEDHHVDTDEWYLSD